MTAICTAQRASSYLNVLI